MSNARLRAVLAALLPLLPLLFPDEPDDSEVDLWPWVAVPFPQAPMPQYISASFSLESTAKNTVARELNSSITPKVLADALTEAWDDTPPVFQALETICKHLLSRLSSVYIPSPSTLAGVVLLVLLLGLAWWVSYRKSHPQVTLGQEARPVPVLAMIGDSPASQVVSSVVGSTPGEHSQSLGRVVDGPPPSCPQARSSSQDTTLASSQSSVASLVERSKNIAVRHPLSTPPPTGSIPSPVQGASSNDLNVVNLEHHGPPPATVHLQLRSPVSQPSVSPQVHSALPRHNCSTSQFACHSGLPSCSTAAEEQDTIPPRSSWSLEKACEKAPFEANISAFPTPDGYSAAPSSPHTPPRPLPQTVLQPRPIFPQPPIPLTPDQLRAAPPLITDEVINGVPTDVSEKTEEPDSDHGSPGTPRARWFSGIRGRLAIVDDRGITYGAKKTRPTDGVMSSPETDTSTGFPIVMPQPLLGVVVPPPFLAARDSRGLGLAVATNGEGPQTSDLSEDQTIADRATKSPVLHGDNSDHDLDSALHVLRADSLNSVLTVTLESEEAQLSALALVDLDATNDAHDALEAAAVEDYLSSSSDWEFVETSSRGRSPERVRLAASVFTVAQSYPVSIHQAEPSHVPEPRSSNTLAGAIIGTPPTRKAARSASRSRRSTSVVVASTGLVGGRAFALTPKGIDYAAEQLAAEVTAGDRGRRRRESITAEAMAKHVDRSVYQRPVLEERRNHLEQVPARVDRDILDGARYPPLAGNAQERRAVCEIGRSRTKTIARATSSVRLEATPSSGARSRSASAALSARVSRATSEPPMRRVESECPAQAGTVPGQGQRPPKLARTSYSDIVVRSQSREPRSRTQSERPIASVSMASSPQAASLPVTTGPRAEESCTRERGFADRGKRRAIDETATAEVPVESASSNLSLRLSRIASDLSSSASSRLEPVQKGPVDLKAGIAMLLSELLRGSRSLSPATADKLRDIANNARARSLQVQSSMVSPDLPTAGQSDVTRSAGTRASSETLSGSALDSAAAACSAPLRLPAVTCSATESPGDSGFSNPGLPSQKLAAHEHVHSECTHHREDTNSQSFPLLPRRDRHPSALAQPALSFAALGDTFDEQKDLITTSRDDSYQSPSLDSGVTVRLGSSSLTSVAKDSHIRQASAPMSLSPTLSLTLDSSSPSASQAGFSSDEGDKATVPMRPHVAAPGSWMFDLHEATDAGMPNRGHQTVPRASRSASTNSMSALAAGEPQAPPGLVRPRWTRLSGGRFDGMRRNVLIQ